MKTLYNNNCRVMHFDLSRPDSSSILPKPVSRGYEFVYSAKVLIQPQQPSYKTLIFNT
jgi:hypothetical protein